MVSGTYLCLKGFEKTAHKYLHSTNAVAAKHSALVANPAINMVTLECGKITGAVRTDFIFW
jgi:predicted DNA repair protein MutK